MAVVKMSDIAQRVGVSVAAVSMALNGRPGVSDAMRERIIAEARACGYDMRRLSAGAEKKKHILVYYTDFSGGNDKEFDGTSIHATFMKGIEQAADPTRVEFTQVYSRTGSLDPADIPAGTDGILVVSVAKHPALLDQIAACGLPCVIVGSSYPGHRIHTVSYDNFGSMIQVVQRLADAGHKKIGFIRTRLAFHNYDERFDGWLCATRRLGLDAGPVVEIAGPPEAIYEALLPWLPEQLAGGTTAFVTWNDYVGLAILRALRSCGVTPGKDVAVVGFDDMPFAVLSDPPLTTVRLQETELSATAVRMLVNLLDHPAQPVCHIQLPLEFIQRESFCPAPTIK